MAELACAIRKSFHSLINNFIVNVRYSVLGYREVLRDNFDRRHNETELPSLPGKVAIVTGGSRGIGAEVVKMLLQCDMEVIIACRKPEEGEKTIQTIREFGVKTGTAKVMVLDNASLESVRNFAYEFKGNYEKLDVLVNNAGVMFTNYKETREGFEERYGVNYLSHFLLTILLIPVLKNAGTSEHHARIVNVSSCAHLLGDIKFEDINHSENFNAKEAYAQSKLAILLFTKSLAKILKEKNLFVTANAVHPGIVNTDLFNLSCLTYIKFILSVVAKNPREGATPITFAAVSSRMEKKLGLYISNCKEAPVNPLANEENIQVRLLQLSLKQVELQSINV